MSNFIFKSYSEIENSYREQYINGIISQGLTTGDWVVTEKCHGSNFSIWYNGIEFNYAKRSSFLGETGSFYNYQKIVEPLKEKVIKIYNTLKLVKDVDVLAVYGEIFGGYYPNVKLKNDASIIQKGVYYAPDNYFYGFDIRVNKEFLDVDTTNLLFETNNFIYAKPIFRGSFEEAIKYNNYYISTIPKQLGLPDVENNYCEGNVIKPVSVKRFSKGDRVILKNKNEKFSEKSNKTKKEYVEFIFTETGKKCLDEVMSLINENRLHNVLSKGETITEKDFGKLMGLYSIDLYNEFNKDFQELFDSLEKPERKQIQQSVSKEVAILIRKNFLNIIDGTFNEHI